MGEALRSTAFELRIVVRWAISSDALGLRTRTQVPPHPQQARLRPLDQLAALLVSYRTLALRNRHEHSEHTYTRANDAHNLARRRRLGGGFLNELQRLGRVVALVDDGLAAPVPYQFLLRQVALIVDVRC